MSTNDALCYGGLGTVFADPSGGVPPYDVSYSNGGNTYDGINASLPVGTYSVTVSDANNCSVNMGNIVNVGQGNAEHGGGGGREKGGKGRWEPPHYANYIP